MADARIRQPVKIVDPTTDANEAGVSAAGDLQTEVAVALPTGANVIGNVGLEAGTNNIGDVDIATLPNDETDDDIVAGGSTASRVIGLTYGWDGTQWERIATDAAGAMDVNVTASVALDVSGATVTVDSELPAAAALADATANPTVPAVGAFGMGFDGVDWNRIAVDAAGQLQVDVLSGGGGPEDTEDDVVAGGQTAALGIGMNYGWDGAQWERVNTDAAGSMDVNVTLALPTGANVIGNVGLEAGTNNIGDVDIVTAPWSATEGSALGEGVLLQGDDGTDRTNVLVDAAGHLQVDVLTGGGTATPSGPTVEALLASAVAAGGTGFLDTAEITEAEKIWQVHIASTIPFKYRIGFQENTVRSPQTGWMFGQAGTVEQWTPSSPDFYAHAGASGGTDTIYVEYFNMDTSDTADIHATVEYAT